MSDVEIVYFHVPVPSLRFHSGSGDEYGSTSTFGATIHGLPVLITVWGENGRSTVIDEVREIATQLSQTEPALWWGLIPVQQNKVMLDNNALDRRLDDLYPWAT